MLKRNIGDILNASLNKIDDIELRMALGKSLNALLKQQSLIGEALYDRLNKEIENSKNSNNDLWNIFTSFVKKEDFNRKNRLLANGFRIVDVGMCVYCDANVDESDLFAVPNRVSEEVFEEQHYLLDCNYDEIEMYLDRKYSVVVTDCYNNEYNMDCVLKLNYRFAEKERDLVKIAKIYKINKPIIFNPWARHAIDICLSENVPFQIKDIIFKENIPVVSGVLMWNVESSLVDVTSSKVAPLEERIIYQNTIDENITVNDFVLPFVDVDDVVKEENAIILFSDNKIKECLKYRILTCIADAECYGNEFKINNLVRVRTKGEVINLLKCFKNKEFDCEFLGTCSDKKLKFFNDYRRELTYYEYEKNVFVRPRTNLPTVAIKFVGVDPVVVDFGNYVLSYLRWNYPDFNWMGVK